MWSTEKFGAVSGRRREVARRPPIFLNPEGIHPEHWRRAMHSVFNEPFILSDFGAEPRPSHVPLLRKCGKLNRQTPTYRNHSKSQKTNNRDLLKSPKNQILQHHNLPAPGLILTLENQRFLAFLTGSALRTEIAVTHSKQSIGAFLTGSRIARKRLSNQSKFSPEFVRGALVAVHGSRLSLATSLSLALTNEGPLATAFRYNAPCPNFFREACNLT
jgi:hypothetical protein